MVQQGTRWCFTLNNPTSGESQALADLLESDHCKYGIVGRETGENGTPHLQGFCIFSNNKRFNTVKSLLGNRYHIELAKGNTNQASDYCKKDGDFDEYGTRPTSPGNQGSWEKLVSYLKDAESYPTDLDLMENFPSLYGRYKRAVLDFRQQLCPHPPPNHSLVQGDLRDWQLALEERLLDDPDDRSIHFLVDSEGNQGKTWFAKYWYGKHSACTQIMGAAKRDDMAHSVKCETKYFFINVPRGQMEYLPYGFLEMLKDRIVFSPKYDSETKILHHIPHVIVLCNEQPDMNKLSSDRYDIASF